MKTRCLILLFLCLFFIKGYTCGPPATASVTLTGPSSTPTGSTLPLTLTKSQPELANSGTTYDAVGVTWELINSSGSVVESSNTGYGRGFNGPYDGSLNLSSSITPGTYTVKGTIQWTRFISNSPCDEANGGCVGGSGSDSYPIQITAPVPEPDLVIAGLDPGNVNENSSLIVEYVVSNQGDPLNSGVTTDIRIWWSTDNNISPGTDIVAATINNVSIINGNPSLSDFLSASITAPDLSSGSGDINYFIILEVDYTNSINEPGTGAENNNTNDDAILITVRNNNTGGRIRSDLDVLETKTSKKDLHKFEILKVIDIQGRIIWEKKSEVRVNYSDLPTSEILILVLNEENNMTTKKVILVE